MIKEDLIALNTMRKRRHLHWKLIYRVSILSIYSIAFLGIAAYHFFADDLNLAIALALFSLGFLFGLLLISRMFGIYWDEERAVISSGRMNFFGLCMIIVYVASRSYAKNVLDYVLHPGVAKLSALTFCFVAGIMLGRLFATISTAHAIYKVNKGAIHPDKL
jgi:hypothetical protein